MVLITSEVLAPLDAYVEAVKTGAGAVASTKLRLDLLAAIRAQSQNPATLVYDPGPDPSPLQRAVADLVKITARAAIRDASPRAIQSAAEQVVRLGAPQVSVRTVALALDELRKDAAKHEPLEPAIGNLRLVLSSALVDAKYEAHHRIRDYSAAVIRTMLEAPVEALARIGAHAYQHPSWRARYSLDATPDDASRGEQYAADMVLEFAVMAQAIVAAVAKAIGYDPATWADVPSAEAWSPPDGTSFEAIRRAILAANGSQVPYVATVTPTEG